MRDNFAFESAGERCAAWLYKPAELDGCAPCVVMAHGFSATRDQALGAYAEEFCAAGYVVLLFDYRHFGDSAGQPRQLLSIARQQQDWMAAIAAARAMPEVDDQRIALWGSSFSGGHVQHLAARDAGIAAVVAQVPFCDGLRNLPALGLGHALKLSGAGLRDVLQSALGFGPYRVPAVGAPGSLAVMDTPDAQPGFAAMTAADSPWQNAVCARIALHVARYRPGRDAARISCPILYAIAERDQVTPAALAHAAARRAPRAETRCYDCGHFDPYLPPLWDGVVQDQVDFLRRHL